MRLAWGLLGVFWLLMLATMLSLANLPIERLPSDEAERDRIEHRLRELNGVY